MTLGQIFDPGTNICPWCTYVTQRLQNTPAPDHPWAKVQIAQVQKKKGTWYPIHFSFLLEGTVIPIYYFYKKGTYGILK